MEWWSWIAAVLGGIVLIWEAVKAIKEFAAPALAVEKRVSELERHEKNDVKRFEQIEERFAKQDETNQALMKGVFALVNHEIDGNGIEKMRDARNMLQNHIIEK